MSANYVQEIKVGDQLDGPSCHVCGAIMVRSHRDRELPAQEKRVETGALRFGDDWPGVFIRGDSALIAGSHLGIMCNYLAHQKALPEFEISKLRNLARLLKSCDMGKGWKCLSCGATTEAS